MMAAVGGDMRAPQTPTPIEEDGEDIEQTWFSDKAINLVFQAVTPESFKTEWGMLTIEKHDHAEDRAATVRLNEMEMAGKSQTKLSQQGRTR